MIFEDHIKEMFKKAEGKQLQNVLLITEDIHSNLHISHPGSDKEEFLLSAFFNILQNKYPKFYDDIFKHKKIIKNLLSNNPNFEKYIREKYKKPSKNKKENDLDKIIKNLNLDFNTHFAFNLN